MCVCARARECDVKERWEGREGEKEGEREGGRETDGRGGGGDGRKDIQVLI